MFQSLSQCAAQQLAELGRQVFQVMHHDGVTHNLAQALVHDPHADEFDAGRGDLHGSLLGVVAGGLVAGLAAWPAIREHEHDLSALGPRHEPAGADEHRLSEGREAGPADARQAPHGRLDRLLVAFDEADLQVGEAGEALADGAEVFAGLARGLVDGEGLAGGEGKRLGGDLQIVIDRMSDAIQAMSGRGRAQ